MFACLALLAEAAQNLPLPSTDHAWTLGSSGVSIGVVLWSVLKYYRSDVLKLIADHKAEREAMAAQHSADLDRRDKVCAENAEATRRNAAATEKLADHIERMDDRLEKVETKLDAKKS